MVKTFLFLLFSIITAESFAQSAPDIKTQLRKVAMGKAEEARLELLDFLEKFPDDEGVLFLSATLTDNPLRALRICEGILKNPPSTQWEDDAQLRIVQYYAIKKDTARALTELENFRKNYPDSEFLLAASDIVKSTVTAPKSTTRLAIAANTTNSAPTTQKPVAQPKEIEKPVSVPAKEVLKEVTKTEVVPQNLQAEALKTGRWALQVGVYADHETAEMEMNRFKNKRIRASILKKDISGTLHYAVLIGDYSSRESAEKDQPIVQTQCACAPYIIEK